MPPNILDANSTQSSVAVRENQNITLTCKADGFPAPKLMWRREDGQGINIERRKKGKPATLNTTMKYLRMRDFQIYRMCLLESVWSCFYNLLYLWCNVYGIRNWKSLHFAYKISPLHLSTIFYYFCFHLSLLHLFLPFTLQCHVFLLWLLVPWRWNLHILLNYIPDITWHI